MSSPPATNTLPSGSGAAIGRLRMTFIDPVTANWNVGAAAGGVSELAGEASVKATADTRTAPARLKAVSCRRLFVTKVKPLAPDVRCIVRRCSGELKVWLTVDRDRGNLTPKRDGAV